MRTKAELNERLRKYAGWEWVYEEGRGYLVWRWATGDNIEFLFIEVAERRKGYGTELFRAMVRRLEARGERPYHSVFGYRLDKNAEAEVFYRSMGFVQQLIGSRDSWPSLEPTRSIYGGDGTVVMWIAWDDLKRNLGI